MSNSQIELLAGYLPAHCGQSVTLDNDVISGSPIHHDVHCPYHPVYSSREALKW